MSAATGAIRLAGVRFSRGGRVIFDGLDLSIPVGGSTAVVAPSGAGKSTLLALIAGLVPPDSGTVSSPFTPAETGIVLQGYGLAGLLTAAENVEVALQSRPGARRSAIRRSAAEVLDLVHLTPVADHLVEELSGGQQQRVRSRAPSPCARGCCSPTSSRPSSIAATGTGSRISSSGWRRPARR